jgi:hypothetical protein
MTTFQKLITTALALPMWALWLFWFDPAWGSFKWTKDLRGLAVKCGVGMGVPAALYAMWRYL